MHVLALTNPDLIRAFLDTERYWADYALGDLEPGLFSSAEWYGVEDNGKLMAVTMLYRGFTPPIFFAMGDGCGVDRVLAEAVREEAIGLSVREEHIGPVRKYYRTDGRIPMWKMGLDARDFTALDGDAMRLTLADIPALQALYQFGGGDAFSPREVETGVFYGIKVGHQLIAVAGTHVVSAGGRIAALGNVMTHPHYRGRGYATAATSAVCRELTAGGVNTIGLSVGRENAPAIRVYEKLGFKKRVPFYEGIAIRHQQSAFENHKSGMESR
jgi:RimJ/RimL family protein N-acetyltransferase